MNRPGPAALPGARGLSRQGSIYIAVLFLVCVMGAFLTNVLQNVRPHMVPAPNPSWEDQAFYLAEAGIHRAIWEAARSTGPYIAANREPLGDGNYSFQALALEEDESFQSITVRSVGSAPASSAKVRRKKVVRAQILRKVDDPSSGMGIKSFVWDIEQ